VEHYRATNRAAYNGTTVEEERARDLALGPGSVEVWLECLDCAAPIRHLRHRDAGNPPKRCPSCRKSHNRALSRAAHNGTTVEEEKAREAAGVWGSCRVCGSEVRAMRQVTCSEECRTIWRRAMFRARRYGTTQEAEVRRVTEAGEGVCRVCSRLTSHTNRAFCDPCWDNGSRRVYRRAVAKYGATHEEAVALAMADSCEVCAKPVERLVADNAGGANGAQIDHDHLTGKVRGLLCGACNRALGHADDSPERLRALAAYLDRHHARRVEVAA
jgi:hypothetical protein